MFRLGTRPLSARTSWPLVPMTSSASPCSVLTALGTSRMFSARRSAVTVMVCNCPLVAVCASAPVPSKASAAAATAWCTGVVWGRRMAVRVVGMGGAPIRVCRVCCNRRARRSGAGQAAGQGRIALDDAAPNRENRRRPARLPGLAHHFDACTQQMLNATQHQTWQQDGCLVLPGFKPAAELAAACARAHALVAAFEPDAGSSRFSTRDRSLVADATLIASADQVRCFFEEEALDDEGRLRVPKAQSINKIGHALHDRDAVFERFSHGPALAALAADLGLVQPQVWQSQLIFKQPHIGGEVGWHQDASFFVTTPQTVTTFWFSLEDATLDNGCLWVQPGGHRSPLREQYVCLRSGGAARLQMQALDTTPWPTTADAVPLPVAAGTLVVFHGLLPHFSAPNRSAKSRLAYTLHATDGRAAYAPENWLQRGVEFPVRGLD